MTDRPTGAARGAVRGAEEPGPLRFGERMSGVEALMWRLGRRDVRFGATMSLVATVEGRISPVELRARLGHLCRVVPRLTERVREPFLAAAPPAWEPDPTFGVDRHVEQAFGPLWEVASSVVSTPFEEHRPPWRVVMVPAGGPAGDAVVLHLHHSYTDGLGGMRLLGELFDLEPDGARPAPEVGDDGAAGAAGAVAGPVMGLEALLVDVESEIRRAAGVWTRAIPWASRTLSAARHDPGRLLESAVELAAALKAQAGAALGPASPVLGSRSAGVALVPFRVSLEALRHCARRLGVTVNDVYLAGLLDGLERYHAKFGVIPISLRLGIPISSRQSEMEMRNQIFGAMVRGPLGYLDFDERARLVHDLVMEGRDMPLAGVIEDLADAAVRFPGGIAAVASAIASLDVMASNVMGPPVPMWLTGRPIRMMVPFGPRSGAAINATLLSYDGVAYIGLNLDPAAVPEPAVLLDCLEAAFEEALRESPAGGS